MYDKRPGNRALVLVPCRAGEYDPAMENKNTPSDRVLWIGDALAYLLVTLLGFSTHGDLGNSSVGRVLATLIPFYTGWLLFAAWGGVLQTGAHPRLWILRSAMTALLAAPFAAVLRGFWLGAPVQPVFVAVMAGVSALVIIIWRSLYIWVLPKLAS